MESAVGQAWVPGGSQKLARLQSGHIWLVLSRAEAQAVLLHREDQEGPSGEAIAGRNQSCGSLATAAILSNMILPVGALHSTQRLPSLLHPQQGGCTAFHSGQFQSMMCTRHAAGQQGLRGSCFRRAGSMPCSCPASHPQHCEKCEKLLM